MESGIDLSSNLKNHIIDNGPMPIYDFMSYAMQNKYIGYYSARDPIGRNKDFITAPEISQLFGEIIGIWCANYWKLSGSPSSFNLIELGPGRGTLMQDLLNATSNVKGFLEGSTIYMVEINHVLTKVQKEKLHNYKNIHWVDSYEDIPKDQFSIIFANEFFDALPVNQYVRKRDNWMINMVDVSNDKQHLCITPYTITDEIHHYLKRNYDHVPDKGIVEINDQANILMKSITQDIKTHGGAFLTVDYGYSEDKSRSFISTIQSVKNHEYNPIFMHIGNADLTAHVNFTTLYDTARLHHGEVYGPITQREFLLNMLIDARKDMLLANISDDKKDEFLSGYDRLISEKQMGNLFKVIAVLDRKVDGYIGF